MNKKNSFAIVFLSACHTQVYGLPQQINQQQNQNPANQYQQHHPANHIPQQQPGNNNHNPHNGMRQQNNNRNPNIIQNQEFRLYLIATRGAR